MNRSLDELRSRRRRTDREHAYDASWTEALDQGLAEVVSALERLTLERRVPIVLHHLLGYGIEEIAELIGVPAGTVGSRMSRGLAQLRTSLEVKRAD